MDLEKPSAVGGSPARDSEPDPASGEQPASAGGDPTERASADLRHRTVLPGKLGRFLVLAGLTGFSIAQPLLDLLGQSLPTWDDRGFSGGSVIFFVLAILIVPPVALWLLDRLAGAAFGSTAGDGVHVLSVALLLAAVGFLIAKALGLTATALVLIVGLAVASLGTFAYRRSPFVRRWLSMMAIVPVAIGALFGFSAVGETLTSTRQVAAEVEFTEGEPPSVVYLVLDELPTMSMLDSEGKIDEVRYPNIAEFAGQSTWYRQASAVSPFTRTAVPSMLTGYEPTGQPIWTDHPENLFSLLAGSHHLSVSESLTKLCGFAVCQGAALAPPAQGEVPKPPKLSPDYPALVGESLRLWRTRVLPGSATAVDLGEFEEERVAPNGVAEPLDEARNEYDRFFRIQPDAQPIRHTEFLDAIGPSTDPSLFFLHLVLPHQPWNFYEDGTEYRIPERGSVGNPPTEWLAQIDRQRHLLQASYADRLIGLIFNKLKASDQFDDSIVVVTADHGITFQPLLNPRVATEQNLAEVAMVPMFIKSPGQTEPQVSDVRATSIDIVPTIADHLGIDLPWDVDGQSLLDLESGEAGGSGSDRRIFDYADANALETRGIISFDVDDIWPEVLDGHSNPISLSDDSVAGLYLGDGLFGSEVGEVGSVAEATDSEAARVDELADLIEPPEDVAPLGLVSGQLDDATEDTTVIVVVDNEVVGTSPVGVRLEGQMANTFAVVLPRRLVGLPLDIRVLRQEGNAPLEELTVESN